MEKYKNMVAQNQQRNDEKVLLALREINKMVREEKQVTVCELVKRTGLSRAFFYNNKTVKEELQEAYKKQQGKDFTKPQQVIFDKAMKKELELLKRKNAEKDKEIAALKKEMARLKQTLDQKTLETIIHL